MSLRHNFKCPCDDQVEVLNRHLDTSLEVRGRFRGSNVSLGVVLVYSILVTKSKGPKASTYSVLFGLESPYVGGTGY